MSEPTTPATPETAAAVVWHDLECGRYSADLDLWLELAQDAHTTFQDHPILDVGAGTGRVTLALASHGHRVVALDNDRLLLRALEQRAARAGLDLATVCADARSMTLGRSDFALCVIPMQTIQLLGGPRGRLDFLRGARAHVLPGASVACAIVTELETFDSERGDPKPSAERVLVEGCEHASQALSVQLSTERVRIERRRTIRDPNGVQRSAEYNLIELDRLSAADLVDDGEQAGLDVLEVREILPTEEHVGSEVVIFRA